MLRCGNEPLSDCVCMNISLQARASKCVQTSCSFKEQILTAQASRDFCHGYPIPEQRRNFCRVFFVALPALTAIVVVLRCVARRMAKIHLWWDDWTALVALRSTDVELGFGLHYWHVEPGNAKPILQARSLLTLLRIPVTNISAKLFYATQMFYVMKQVAAKASICALYLRIFVTRWSRLVVIGLLVSLVFQHFLFLFLVIFQCTPIQLIWDRSIAGSCLNITAIGYAGAALTLTYDFILIVLPMPQLLKLSTRKRKKLVPIFLLTLGSFACVASMIRLKYLVSFSNTFDATWDNVEIVIWSTLEINLAMICGSLPALRPLFNRAKDAMGFFNHRKHNRSVAEYEDQTKLADFSQSHGSSHPCSLPNSPQKPEELGCVVSKSSTDD
ncbi:CFEM domain containing integral membrane protein [Colletotrichum incanum]|nr:CFEM domain containing integral membrane protein [Colletotrichum incanum]